MILSSPRRQDTGGTSDVAASVVEMDRVRVWAADGTDILQNVSWTVRAGEHWALLGPNGAGKSTLLALAGAARHPSEGTVTVLGGRLGRIDMPALRRRIGVVDADSPFLDWLTAEAAVLTGKTATRRPLWERYGEDDRHRARDLLALVGCAGLVHRSIASCSQGERQRIRIARALMAEPPLLLLDEPATGLDLPAREALLAALAASALSRPGRASILVTHHLEELPTTITHALLLRSGAIVASGGVDDILHAETVSACFGLDVRVGRSDGRWFARAVGAWTSPSGNGTSAGAFTGWSIGGVGSRVETGDARGMNR